MNFNSQQKRTEEEDEAAAAMSEDTLDEVYGTPATSGKKRSNKNAETLRDMIKESKGDLYQLLLKRLKGESYAR